jgi:hypothetical protein
VGGGFAELEGLSAEAISQAFAEPAVILPRVSAQYAERVVDPERLGALVEGVFSAGPAEDRLKGTGRGAEFSGTSRVISMSAEFWLPKAQVDALAALPAKGDKLTLTNRAGAPVYAISAVQHTDMGDITLILVREDAVP